MYSTVLFHILLFAFILLLILLIYICKHIYYKLYMVKHVTLVHFYCCIIFQCVRVCVCTSILKSILLLMDIYLGCIVFQSFRQQCYEDFCTCLFVLMCGVFPEYLQENRITRSNLMSSSICLDTAKLL